MNFINKINNYLIQRYPTIWNTRIVWMLAINLLVHILFYFIGFVSHSSPLSLQNSRVIDDYYNSGLIMVHIIISLLLLVGWLVYMFKNNGFKNFYPTSNLKLFGQFVCYLVIVFASISFYFSYMFGLRAYINIEYPNEQLVKNVDIINKAYPFLSVEYQDYTLNKKAFPKPFYDLYCETSDDLIDYNKKYFETNGNKYQFYSLYKVAITERDDNGEFKYPAVEYKNGTDLAYKEVVKDTCVYYFKKEVVDVSADIKTTNLSYYNFSRVFYTLDFEEIDFYDRHNYSYTESPAEYVIDYGTNPNAAKNYKFSKQFSEILDRKDPAEIKKILSDFLEVSKKYQIRTNLNTDEWFKLIYHPDTFEVKNFIAENENTYSYPIDSVAATIDTLTTDVATAATASHEQTVVETVEAAAVAVAQVAGSNDKLYNYYNRNLTKNYYQVNNLSDFLRSVELIKNVDFVSRNIHVYLWIAFFFSTLIFSFRVTNLRSVIFTGITTGVLSLVIGLMVLVYSMGLGGDEEYFAAYLVFIIASIIILIPFLFMTSASKLFTSIFMNITINGFVLYVLLILGIISMHQNDACRTAKDYYSSYPSKTCTTILEYLDMNTSYLLLAVGLLFMFIYTAVIKKWRAVPE